jgi:hypothetical protein
VDVYDNIDEMVALCRKKIELMIELKKALRLAELLGVPPKDLKDKVTVSVASGKSLLTPWYGAVFSVRVGDEPHKHYSMDMVHHDLWPADMLEQYDRRKAATQRAQRR